MTSEARSSKGFHRFLLRPLLLEPSHHVEEAHAAGGGACEQNRGPVATAQLSSQPTASPKLSISRTSQLKNICCTPVEGPS